MRVQIGIPHYFSEQPEASSNPNRYGSLLKGARLERSIALARCITALFDLQRNAAIASLNHHTKSIDIQPSGRSSKLDLEISIFTDKTNRLTDVLNLYEHRIKVIETDLANSLDLPATCRDQLIQNTNDCDVICYMEDDIVIHDPLFFDKQFWFLTKTNHQCVLMPHRYERIDNDQIERLFIDGQLADTFEGRYPEPKQNVAHGKFLGNSPVAFDIASNPHSGTFTISKQQASQLESRNMPVDGFVGKLETAATLTVLQYFTVLKPSLKNWDFLCVEHAHPSFRGYVSQLPINP